MLRAGPASGFELHDRADHFDTIVIGAGAAGMMCASEAAAGGRVLVLEHMAAPGEKIRISGGGRCNFTNLHCSADRFLASNRHFAKSALRRYSQHDFIALIERNGISWHEKTLGQLFCDGSARQIVSLLVSRLQESGAELRLGTRITSPISQGSAGFGLRVEGPQGPAELTCRNLVVASGGKSIPKMGATGLGYAIAKQFGHGIVETRPALVPLVLAEDVLAQTGALAGISLPVRATLGKTSFDEAMLFTHRGLSGPAILQISSYWHQSLEISLDLLPGTDSLAALRQARQVSGRRSLASALGELLPRRLAEVLVSQTGLAGNLADLSDARLEPLAGMICDWRVRPIATEGYRIAEVTAGGVDTGGLNAATMESRTVPGLYFIGEVVDVTGWLGGYNFQWAWSSGWVSGQAIAAGKNSTR